MGIIGSVRKGGWVSVQSMGEVGKDFCPNFLQPFLENIDRRSCNDGSRELIPEFHNPRQKIPTLSFDGGSHLGVPWRGARLGHVEQEEGKIKFWSVSKRPLNILQPVIRSTRNRHVCKEWSPGHCSLSSLGRWRMPVTNFVAFLWIRSRWLRSATRFGEQAGIPYPRCGRAWKPISGDLGRSALSWRSIV